MTYHLPVLPPELAGPHEGFTPREAFSPSQLAAFAGEGGCKRKWALRSLWGVSEVKKSIATVLGSLIHGALEQYLKGRTVYDLVHANGALALDARTLKEVQSVGPERLAELVAEAPKRALAGLHYLPNIKDPNIEVIEVERWLDLDTTKIIGGVGQIKLNGKIDLSIRRAGVWYLYDHKSTKGRRAYRGQPADPWAYCKTPEQLLKDPQSVFYALDVMLRHNLDALWCRWVYYLTDPDAHPQAKAVDVELKRADVLQAAYEWLLVAVEMRDLVRRAKAGALALEDIEPAKVLPPDPLSPCKSYGGCPYHYEKGGPCMPEGEVKLGSLILSNAKPTKEKDMSLAQTLEETKAAIAGTQPPLVPQNPLLPPEAHAAPAPSLPPLPAGWEYGPGNAPRHVAPAGFQYNAAGTELQPIPPPPVVAPSLAPPVGYNITPPPLPEQPTPAAEGGKKGRPKGSKNKGAEDVIDLLFAAAKDGNQVIATITVGQMNAIRDVVEAAA